MIRTSGYGFLAVGGCHLVDTTVPMAKLQGVWIDISHDTTSLHLERLIIEGDSLTVISWIQQAFRFFSAHPLIYDIVRMLRRCIEIVVMFIRKPIRWLIGWLPMWSIIMEIFFGLTWEMFLYLLEISSD